MTRLEERYRSLLRLLPAWYRQAWGDDMVAAFLESMDRDDDPEAASFVAEYGRPPLSEVASVVALAIRLRVGAVDAPPRPYAWGQAVRLAVLMTMLVNAAASLTGIAITVWLSGRISWLPTPPPDAIPALGGPLNVAWRFAGDAWLPAFIALIFGHRRVAQAVALIAIVPGIVSAVVLTVDAGPGHLGLTVLPWTMRAVDILVLIAMTAFPDGVPPVRPVPWLRGLAVGVLAVLALFGVEAVSPPLRVLDWPGLCCAVVVLAIAVHRIRSSARHREPDLAWSLAFTLLAAVALALRVFTLPFSSVQAQWTLLGTVALVEIVVIVAVALPFAIQAIRLVRRLPAVVG